MLSADTSLLWSMTETARDSGHRLSTITAPAGTFPAAGAIMVDPAQRFQEMTAFGGALTESSAWGLAQIPAEKRAHVLHRYYDPKDRIGVNESNSPVYFLMNATSETLACAIPAHAIQTYSGSVR